MGCVSAYGGWQLATNSITLINEDLGPSPNYLRMPLANSLANTVGYILFGRLSDLFGRGWLMIGCNVLVHKQGVKVILADLKLTADAEQFLDANRDGKVIFVKTDV